MEAVAQSIWGNPYLTPQAHIKQALHLLGFDTTDPSTKDTPERFIKYLMEFMQPVDLKELLGDGFEAPKDHGIHAMVAQSGIPFRMVCEHHLLPAWGTAAVGYIPLHRVVGLSKLSRLVDAVGTARPTLQESVTEKVADALTEHLKARGAIVVISSEHSCMACRGVNKPDVVTHTSAIRGIFRDVPAARQEFFDLIRQR